MIDSKFKVVVNQKPGAFGVDIYIMQIDKFGKHISVAQPIEFVFKEVKKEDEFKIKPTIELGRFFADDFLKAWVEAAKEKGLKPEEDYIMQGKLEATKYHLEDMRKIVFEDKEPIIKLDPNYSCEHGSCLPGKCNYKEEEKK